MCRLARMGDIQRPKAEDYAQDVDLFEESSQFVAGG